MTDIYEFDASTDTITSIDKDYAGYLVVPRQISGKDIKIIDSKACNYEVIITKSKRNWY